jgi:heme/copper-type cytochrome/quinol oxidase subunit 4
MKKSLASKDISRNKGTGKKLFQPPWKYREGFILALILVLAGFLIEIATPRQGISIPSFPFNMYAGMAFITTIVFLHFFYRDDQFVRWLSTMPAATSSILLITLLTILMGVFNQTDPEAEGIFAALGLTHMKNSWVFLLAQLYVLSSLGLVTLRRSIPLKKKNIGFILNHAGLWIVIATASLGTGDLQRLRMELHKGEPVWYAFDGSSHVRQLPFALELVNFDIEEYPPQLAIVDSHTGLLSDPSQKPLPHIAAGKKTRLLEWEIEVFEFLPMAIYREGEFIHSDEVGAPPVARVKAVNVTSGESHEKWITCGSFMYDAEYIWLDGRNVLIMTTPEPRRYQSHVIARTLRHEPRELFIEVNKPPKIEGWRLYQMSYNQAMGKWSHLSVLEIVRDPWLPLVYAGFIMLFAGAAYIFWIGKELKEE